MAQKITHALILASTSNGVIATDANGHIVLINHQAASILKLDQNGVIGSHITAVLPMTGRLIIKCLETGKSQLGRHIVGKKISLVVSVTPILEAQRILGAMGNFQKMSDFEDSAQQLESYRRLNVQLDDIFELVNHLLDKYNRQYALRRRISPDAMEQIKSYSFPGNVRELKNIIKMAVMMSETDSLDDYILRNLKKSVREHPNESNKPGSQMSLIEEMYAFEKSLLQNAMTDFKTTREMARFLRINQSTVVRKMKKHDLAW